MLRGLVFLLATSSTVLGFPSQKPVKAMKVVKEANRILCPVLASMANAGDLVPDEDGDVTTEQIYDGLHEGIGCRSDLAELQAEGITDYDRDNKLTGAHRDRCFAGTPCWIKKKLFGVTDATTRWINLYTMNGRQTVEHGASTGVRGGATNVPEFDYTGGPCNGTYPCEERFQKFYVPCADENGRLNYDGIDCIICRAWAMGDRGGEFGYNPTQAGMQWQVTAAMHGWIDAFGRTDEKGELYLTLDDARAMLMEGRYPDGWVKRGWGGMQKIPESANWPLQCRDKDGYNPVWWSGTSCESHTGETCAGDTCGGGASCINSRCVCGLGSNGISMCARDGQCQERENKCTYFGEPCQMIPADNPSAPW